MCYDRGMDSGLLLPVMVVYVVCCVLLNWAINLLNASWREAHLVRPEQTPEPVARWLLEHPGIRVYHGAPGHPFTPGTVVLGVFVSVLATYALVNDTALLPWQVLAVLLAVLAVGGVVMSFGDLARYVRWG